MQTEDKQLADQHPPALVWTAPPKAPPQALAKEYMDFQKSMEGKDTPAINALVERLDAAKRAGASNYQQYIDYHKGKGEGKACEKADAHAQHEYRDELKSWFEADELKNKQYMAELKGKGASSSTAAHLDGDRAKVAPDLASAAAISPQCDDGDVGRERKPQP